MFVPISRDHFLAAQFFYLFVLPSLRFDERLAIEIAQTLLKMGNPRSLSPLVIDAFYAVLQSLIFHFEALVALSLLDLASSLIEPILLFAPHNFLFAEHHFHYN